MDLIFDFYCDAWYFAMPAFDSFAVDLSVIFPVTELRHYIFDHFDQIVTIWSRYFWDWQALFLFLRGLCMSPGDDDCQRYWAYQRLRWAVLFKSCAPGGFCDSSCFMEISSRFILPSFLHGCFRGYEFVKEFYFHFTTLLALLLIELEHLRVGKGEDQTPFPLSMFPNQPKIRNNYIHSI